MQKLTNRQLEVMKEAIENRNEIASMPLQEYYLKHYFLTDRQCWDEANNNIVRIYRFKYRLKVCKHLEEKQYLKVLWHNAIYICVQILQEV